MWIVKSNWYRLESKIKSRDSYQRKQRSTILLLKTFSTKHNIKITIEKNPMSLWSIIRLSWLVFEKTWYKYTGTVANGIVDREWLNHKGMYFCVDDITNTKIVRMLLNRCKQNAWFTL